MTSEIQIDEFSKLLTKCHNIIRNNDRLSPVVAFDEISKILFIKIRYEKNNSKRKLFSLDELSKDRTNYEKYKANDELEFYQFLFEQTKVEFKDDLFSENEKIRIKQDTFETIVQELEKYNLSTISDNIQGKVFEQFLGKTFRGKLGQFFTPRTVVEFMTEILDPREGEVICDPCCGSGSFLIKSFEYIRSQIEENIQKEKENIKKKFYDKKYKKLNDKEKAKVDDEVAKLLKKLNSELDKNSKNSRVQKLSNNSIFGTDINLRMSRTAKMNMIMHGDSQGGVHHNNGLLNVNGIFENRFDVIFTSPPFGVRIEKSLLNLYNTGKMSHQSEVIFIERCLNLLKAGGRMGIVLPDGVLNNSNLQKVRDYIESKAKIILITSLPQDVFIASGTSIKLSLLFLKKFTEEEAKEYELIKEEAIQTINYKYKDILENIENKIEVEIKIKIKEKFNYEIPIAEVKKAGISISGAKIENEFEPLQEEFKIYKAKNKLWENKESYLKYVSFSELDNWNIKYLLETPFSYNNKYELSKMGSFLSRNKTSINILDDENYKRITIKRNNGGIFLRDIEKGINIGTKRQFIVKEGQFLVSKIDAGNGAFGVIPSELDNAIITSNFWTFDVDYSLINPYFLSLITTTQEFILFCSNASKGVTNRLYLNEEAFLNVKIPLPSLKKQNELFQNYNSKILLAQKQEQQAIKNRQDAIKEFKEEIFTV
ncbi:MAG: N-6 DNA methylase [Sulfurovum sp.]